MRIEVNVEKKYAFIIISLLVVIAGVVIGYAYNSSPANPAVMGHSINEVDGITCVSGQAVTRNSSGWGCVALNTFNVDALKIACNWSGWFYGDSSGIGYRTWFDTGTWEGGYFINLYCNNGYVTNSTSWRFFGA
jgi:hypothetical protein